VLPYDFLPVDDEEITKNMYWYYGQQDLKAAVQVKDHPNLFACFVSNFSCAPDSFLLHYLRWISNTKPFLVLELDSHTADAGVDTRIEAFLDIIEGYRRAKVGEEPMMVERDWDVFFEGVSAHVLHKPTGERVSFDDPRVTMVWPSMGSWRRAWSPPPAGARTSTWSRSRPPTCTRPPWRGPWRAARSASRRCSSSARSSTTSRRIRPTRAGST